MYVLMANQYLLVKLIHLVNFKYCLLNTIRESGFGFRNLSESPPDKSFASFRLRNQQLISQARFSNAVPKPEASSRVTWRKPRRCYQDPC